MQEGLHDHDRDDGNTGGLKDEIEEKRIAGGPEGIGKVRGARSQGKHPVFEQVNRQLQIPRGISWRNSPCGIGDYEQEDREPQDPSEQEQRGITAPRRGFQKILHARKEISNLHL
jgi:hypothetical protein